jgi:two-component system LytT family response regulator
MKESLNYNLKKIEKLEMLVLESLEKQQSLDNNIKVLNEFHQAQKIAINSASKIDFIPVEEIIYCKANLAYTEIISFNSHVLTATKSLNEFEKQLSNAIFFRINKSILVNINHVYSFNKRSSQVLMKNNVLLEVARRRKVEFVNTMLEL